MRFVATLAAVVLSSAVGQAQSAGGPIRIATREVRPFVYDDNGKLTGFSVELWQEISSRLHLRSEFVVKKTIQELLDSVRSHETAAGIAAISITAEREKELDLSQPMFDAGLQILTPLKESRTGMIAAIIAGALSSAALPILGLVLAIIVGIAHLVWLFERRNASGLASCSSPISPPR